MRRKYVHTRVIVIIVGSTRNVFFFFFFPPPPPLLFCPINIHSNSLFSYVFFSSNLREYKQNFPKELLACKQLEEDHRSFSTSITAHIFTGNNFFLFLSFFYMSNCVCVCFTCQLFRTIYVRRKSTIT